MNAHHADEPRNAEPSAPAANGRRRFLLGAAGLAATPLLLGTVGCTATAPAGSTPPALRMMPIMSSLLDTGPYRVPVIVWQPSPMLETCKAPRVRRPAMVIAADTDRSVVVAGVAGEGSRLLLGVPAGTGTLVSVGRKSGSSAYPPVFSV